VDHGVALDRAGLSCRVGADHSLRARGKIRCVTCASITTTSAPCTTCRWRSARARSAG
jgi:hypothetical protein